MFKRILAVGDIRGMYYKLIALMKKVKFDPEQDLLIFLGDYIDGDKYFNVDYFFKRSGFECERKCENSRYFNVK